MIAIGQIGKGMRIVRAEGPEGYRQCCTMLEFAYRMGTWLFSSVRCHNSADLLYVRIVKGMLHVDENDDDSRIETLSTMRIAKLVRALLGLVGTAGSTH